MYADEIEQYAEILILMKVSQTSYGKPIHKLYWALDKEPVIEHITPSNGVEKPLPPPTKLNITNFDRIPHMILDSAFEIGISFLIASTTLNYTCLLIDTFTTHSIIYYIPRYTDNRSLLWSSKIRRRNYHLWQLVSTTFCLIFSHLMKIFWISKHLYFLFNRTITYHLVIIMVLILLSSRSQEK